jgi:CheY-like chemotaxis protein
MTERQTVDLEPADNYSDFLEAIKRNLDPTSNTVLLVDDEKTIRMKVARDVRAFDPGMVVYEAANGSEAMEKLKVIRAKYLRDPLLIVLDLNMPVMDGWEVIKILKKEYEAAGKAQGIPILVLSSTSGEKGGLFMKQSVHDGKSGYTPLVSVAKEMCTNKSHYDAAGEKGLMTWLKFFVKR